MNYNQKELIVQATVTAVLGLLVYVYFMDHQKVFDTHHQYKAKVTQEFSRMMTSVTKGEVYTPKK